MLKTLKGEAAGVTCNSSVVTIVHRINELSVVQLLLWTGTLKHVKYTVIRL